MKIFYLHIPKTGGQTLATRLASAFPIGRSDIMGSDLRYPDGVDQLKSLMEKNDFVERHLAGPVLKDIHAFDLLATVREPVSQIVSNYFHICNEPQNMLYRPASFLSPREFFDKYGDILGNNQSRYLVSYFFDQVITPEPLLTYSRLLWDALDRIRWIVPTESIDEYIALWSIEMGRHVPNPSIMINVTNKDARFEELFQIVHAKPHLYSLDLLLWELVRDRFLSYKKGVLRAAIPWNAPDDTSRAYWGEASGI